MVIIWEMVGWASITPITLCKWSWSWQQFLQIPFYPDKKPEMWFKILPGGLGSGDDPWPTQQCFFWWGIQCWWTRCNAYIENTVDRKKKSWVYLAYWRWEEIRSSSCNKAMKIMKRIWICANQQHHLINQLLSLLPFKKKIISSSNHHVSGTICKYVSFQGI